MRILAVNFPKTEKDERKLAFFNKNYDDKMKKFIESESKMMILNEPNLEELRTQGVDMMTQFTEIIKRNRKGIVRDPMQSKAKIGQQVIFSLVVVAIFYDIGFHNEGGLDDKVDSNAPPQRRAQ
jgi:hypothetical protein